MDRKHNCLHEREFGTIEESIDNLKKSVDEFKKENVAMMKTFQVEIAKNTQFRSQTYGIIGFCAFIFTLAGVTITKIYTILFNK